MYLFTRTLQLTGPVREATGWAVEVAAFVNAHGSNRVSLWTSNYGQPIGRVVWSTWVDSMADVTAMFASLGADDDYHALIGRGGEFIAAPAEDELRQAIYGGPRETPPPMGAVTTMTTAVMANGKYAEGLAWGAEMAALVQRIGGHPSIFFADSFGAFGQVTWLTTSPDMASAESASNAINADVDYMARLADVATLFLPGSGRRAMASRIA